MKKFMLRIMAWLMVVAMMLPFAGTNLSAQAATYVGDYGSAWQFTSADFEGISGKATITLDVATTGDKDYYQFSIYKNVDGWPKLEQSNLADDKYQINSWGFIDIKPDDTKVTFTLTEQTVKELQTEYEIGIQVFGVIINDAKVSGAAAKATPTPAPTATPAPTKAPAAATPTKAPAAPTKAPEPTKAPATTVGKELVVTKDMVKNGTVTIENAKYDTIEIPRDIDAKSVTLKNVTAGALEVQSGADYVVTLSGSDVDTLAVTNPEVPGISQKTLLQMIKDKKAITEEVLLAYRAYTEQAAKVANLQPVINATGTDVDKVTVSGSAKLSVTGCDVLVDAKGASAALNVELAGFAGSVDVAVESVDNGYSIANLTLTNSNVAKVNVSGKDGSCKITGNSDVDNVVVSGKNTVTVDVDAKEVSVDKNATDAKVRIYRAVDTVNVAGKENDIVLASAAAVKTANVTGSDIRVYGYGKLDNAEITGTGANVAVAGTAVNGENDFTTPEVMKEMNPLKEIIRHKQDISSAPDDDNDDDNTTTNPPAGSEEEDKEPIATLTESGNYEFALKDYLPDIAVRDVVKITVGLSCDVYFNGTLGANTYAEGEEWGTWATAGEVAEVDEIELEIDVPFDSVTAQLQLWSLNEGSETGLVIESITVERVNAGGDDDTLDLTGATECTTDKWQVHHFTSDNLVAYAGKTVSFSVKMAVVCEEGSVTVKAQDSAYSAMYVDATITDEWKTFTYNVNVPADYSTKDSAYLGFRWEGGNDDYANYKFYYKDYVFTAPEQENGGNEEGLDLTGAEECNTNAWQVHHFTEDNLVDYAGKTASFSVKMAVICDEGSVTVKAQDSGYSTMYNDATITGEWKTFEYTFAVPADYSSKTEAYPGFRWAAEEADYANYKFYYKDYVFTAPEQ